MSIATKELQSVEYTDRWCGHCGEVFINRPSSAEDQCDFCGKPLSQNPQDGPVNPRNNVVGSLEAYIRQRLDSVEPARYRS